MDFYGIKMSKWETRTNYVVDCSARCLAFHFMCSHARLSRAAPNPLFVTLSPLRIYSVFLGCPIKLFTPPYYLSLTLISQLNHPLESSTPNITSQHASADCRPRRPNVTSLSKGRSAPDCLFPLSNRIFPATSLNATPGHGTETAESGQRGTAEQGMLAWVNSTKYERV
jgi:hypothetical protein